MADKNDLIADRLRAGIGQQRAAAEVQRAGAQRRVAADGDFARAAKIRLARIGVVAGKQQVAGAGLVQIDARRAADIGGDDQVVREPGEVVDGERARGSCRDSNCR